MMTARVIPLMVLAGAALAMVGVLAGADSGKSRPRPHATTQPAARRATGTKFKLVPSPKESRILIYLLSAKTGEYIGQWSLLVPECVSCREGMTGHCHIIPPKWEKCRNGWIVRLELDKPRCVYTTRITVRNAEEVDLKFTVKNLTSKPLTDVEGDFCFCCVAEPEFSSKDWYNRVYVHTTQNVVKKGKVLTEGKFLLGGAMRVNFPVAFNPGYSVYGNNVADVPMILCKSLNGKKVYAAGFEHSSRLHISVGTCIHAVAWLGTIPPKAEATCKGRFYYIKGSRDDMLKRFKKDFGRQAGV